MLLVVSHQLSLRLVESAIFPLFCSFDLSLLPAPSTDDVIILEEGVMSLLPAYFKWPFYVFAITFAVFCSQRSDRDVLSNWRFAESFC